MSYEPSNDMPTDNDYVSRTGQLAIPVTKDENEVEDPIDAETADSDEVLGKSVTYTFTSYILRFPENTRL